MALTNPESRTFFAALASLTPTSHTPQQTPLPPDGNFTPPGPGLVSVTLQRFATVIIEEPGTIGARASLCNVALRLLSPPLFVVIADGTNSTAFALADRSFIRLSCGQVRLLEEIRIGEEMGQLARGVVRRRGMRYVYAWIEHWASAGLRWVGINYQHRS